MSMTRMFVNVALLATVAVADDSLWDMAKKAAKNVAGVGDSMIADAPVDHRVVAMLGASGQGKSWLGNRLLYGGQPCHQTTDFCFEEPCNKCFFAAAEDPCAVTKGAEAVTRIVEWERDGVLRKLNLTIIDTPGMADTSGRSIEFLDMILSTLRQNPPDMVMFVDTGVRNTLLQSTTALLRFAFHDRLSPLNSIAVLNKYQTLRGMAKELTDFDVKVLKSACDNRDGKEQAPCRKKKLEEIARTKMMMAARMNFFDHLVDPSNPGVQEYMYTAIGIHPENEGNKVHDVLDHIYDNAKIAVNMDGIESFTDGQQMMESDVQTCRTAIEKRNAALKSENQEMVNTVFSSEKAKLDDMQKRLTILEGTEEQKKKEVLAYDNAIISWIWKENPHTARILWEEASAERQEVEKFVDASRNRLNSLEPCTKKQDPLKAIQCLNEINRACEATLYEHWKTNGHRAAFPVGKVSFLESGVDSMKRMHGIVSAITVHGDENCRATLYERPYTGWEVTFGPGVHTLEAILAKGGENDRTSAINVYSTWHADVEKRAPLNPDDHCKEGFPQYDKLQKYKAFREEAGKSGIKTACVKKTESKKTEL